MKFFLKFPSFNFSSSSPRKYILGLNLSESTSRMLMGIVDTDGKVIKTKAFQYNLLMVNDLNYLHAIRLSKLHETRKENFNKSFNFLS